MLRIGDIHITSGYKDHIIDELKRVVADAGEESVIFLGDYVYHFSYDRRALLAFMDFLVELQSEGMSVYILAGNHDRLQGHFVYQEAQRVVKSLGGSRIHFVTEPTWKKIDEERILFLPRNPGLRYDDVVDDNHEYVDLIASSHKSEQLSGHVNMIMEAMLTQRPTSERIIVAHHYYVANTTFPGQQGRFGYKSVAIDPKRCDRDDVLMISGHIHKPFVWKNYLCLGSVWATHPQEYNQTKVVLRRSEGSGELLSCAINFYASLPASEEQLSVDVINALQKDSRDAMMRVMEDGSWSLSASDMRLVPIGLVSLQLQVEQRSYQSMDERVDEGLQHSLRDIQLQAVRSKSYDDLVSDLIISHEELQESYVQRKTILETYVTNKYPDEQEEYIALLQESDII